MRSLFITGNALRHKYFVNELAKFFDESLVISECKNSVSNTSNRGDDDRIIQHFLNRDLAETKLFGSAHSFAVPCTPILYKEASSSYICSLVKSFRPDFVFVFGSSIIKSKLLNLLPKDRTFNLHLGLVPYCKGSGTNFWPFVNDELEYIGASILALDSGIDTGGVYSQIVPIFDENDDAHSIGCKVIKQAIEELAKIIKLMQLGKTLECTPQRKTNYERIYKNSDFSEHSVSKYLSNLAAGIVEKYCKDVNSKKLDLIQLKVKF